jgi:hypothetical protein
MKNIEIKEGKRENFECSIIKVYENKMKVEWLNKNVNVK